MLICRGAFLEQMQTNYKLLPRFEVKESIESETEN